VKGVRRIALLASLGLTAGCAGSLASSGDIGGQPVYLDGTGWTWIDETQYVFEDGGWSLQEYATDTSVTLHLRFSSAVFDPAVDMRGLSRAERDRIEEEIARGDYLELRIRRGDRLRAGDTLEYDSEEPSVPDASPFIGSSTFLLGDELLDNASEYPERVEALASRREARLELVSVEPRLAGVLDFEISAGEDDPDTVVEGTLQVRFDLQPLGERLAECNYDPTGVGGGGALSPCETLVPGTE
jgi:hypothetical protein